MVARLIPKDSAWRPIVETVVKGIVPALVTGLFVWVWNTNAQIAAITQQLSQDKVQWRNIRQNADDIIELKIRLGVIEKLKELEQTGSIPTEVITGKSGDSTESTAEQSKAVPLTVPALPNTISRMRKELDKQRAIQMQQKGQLEEWIEGQQKMEKVK